MTDVAMRGETGTRFASAKLMFSHLNAFILAIQKSLSGIEIYSATLGKPCLSKAAGGRRHGLVVHADVSGMVNGGTALWIDLRLANQLATQLLMKIESRDRERRAALQMFYNEVAARAGRELAKQEIAVQFSVPQVYSAAEWLQGAWANVAMIEIPVRTSAGDCRQAVHLRVA